VAFNFLPCDRDQAFLMPPSLKEWLPEDHLAWFVLDAVDQIDLAVFYRRYRDDGWGAAAFDPQMMVPLLLYAYCVGERSSRRIERPCREDVGLSRDGRQPGPRPHDHRPLPLCPRVGQGCAT
jgi:transposase